MLYSSALKLACAFSHQIELYILDNIQYYIVEWMSVYSQNLFFILLNLRKSESLISKINLA